MVTRDESNDIVDIVAKIRGLREKQLSGTDLSDEELREGIRLLSQVRTLRAGKTASIEKDEPLNKMF